MMRLVDATKLHHELVVDMVKCIRMNEENKGTMSERVLNKIDESPTIDAVPVDMVAQMLCDAFGDECPCNYSGIDEWLPEVCELQDECPNPKDRLGCWKQYIKHYGERKK